MKEKNWHPFFHHSFSFFCFQTYKERKKENFKNFESYKLLHVLNDFQNTEQLSGIKTNWNQRTIQ